MFAGKKSAQIREILISESAWEEMTCLFAPSPANASKEGDSRRPRLSRRVGFFPRNQKKSQYFYPSVNLKDIYAYIKNYL